MCLFNVNFSKIRDDSFVFVLRKAVEEARDPELQGVTVYVAQDCTGKCCDYVDFCKRFRRSLCLSVSTWKWSCKREKKKKNAKMDPQNWDYVDKGVLGRGRCLFFCLRIGHHDLKALHVACLVSY